MTATQRKLHRSSDCVQELIVRVAAVEHLDGYNLRLRFDDGVTKDVDLWPVIKKRGGVFTPLKNVNFFGTVFLDQDAGTIAWPNGVDFAPEVLYCL